MTAPQEAVAQTRNRLPLMVGGGVALLLVLFLGAKMFGGGGGTKVGVAQPFVPTAGAKTTPATKAPAAAGQSPVETFEVFTTKNPFVPLRTAAPPAGAPAAAAPAAPAPTVAATTGTVAATPVGITAPAAAGQTTATGGTATEPVRSTRVALLDVFADGDHLAANVRVNDTVSKVAAGDMFGSNFKVVSLDSASRCGRFLFGDDQFSLCKGEEALK